LGVQNVPQNIYQYCSKVFSRNDNLKRHISVCKLNISVTSIQKYPKKRKKVAKIMNLNVNFVSTNIKVIVDSVNTLKNVG